MFDWLKSGALERALHWLRSRFSGEAPPGSPRDPYAWKPAPLKPRPHLRSGAVALKEPDDD